MYIYIFTFDWLIVYHIKPLNFELSQIWTHKKVIPNDCSDKTYYQPLKSCNSCQNWPKRTHTA